MLEYHIFVCAYFTSISRYYTGCLSNMRDAWYNVFVWTVLLTCETEWVRTCQD